MRSFAATALVVVLCAAFAEARPSGRAVGAPCRDAGDRATKLTLIERLRRKPGILILGSSRARIVEPSFLQRLTGRSGFNAAVTGGTAADGWVMTRYTADRFPQDGRRYILFVDAEIATDGVPSDLAADPRARKYLAGVRRVAGTCRLSSRYAADGSIAYLPPVSPAQRARTVATTLARVIASIRANPPRGGRVDPRRYTYFERMIAFMNRHGSRPVVVLNPIYPTILAELEKYGFPARKRSRAYLDELHQRLDFVDVDCEDIRTWGGSAAHFSNAKHVDRVNMRRMLRYIVAHSGGALA